MTWPVAAVWMTFIIVSGAAVVIMSAMHYVHKYPKDKRKGEKEEKNGG